MDEPDHPTFGSASDDDAAAPRPAAGEDAPCTVYHGDAERVREGFVIALGLLGLGPPMAGNAAPTPPKEGE